MTNNNLAYAYIDSWNEKDVDKIYSFFHKRAVYIDTTLDQELTGERIRSHIQWIVEICPNMRFEIIDCTPIIKGRCAVEWLMYGNNLDPFYAGAPVSEEEPILGVDFLRFKGERIISTHVYFDHAGRNSDVNLRCVDMDDHGKYQKSGLKDQDVLRYKRHLEELMIQEKKYLNSDLTLSILAACMNISTNHLSQIINGQFEKNFYDFVNHYRVDEAMSCISDKNNSGRSTLEIAFEVGFGSSSSFYHAFKKITGQTPTQLKKSFSDE